MTQIQEYKPVTQAVLMKLFDANRRFDQQEGKETEFFSKNPKKNAKLRSNYQKQWAMLPKGEA